MKNIFIQGKGVYLRGLREEDVSTYYHWLNDQDVCKYNSHGYLPYSARNMESYLENILISDSNLVLAIVHEESGKHVGNISLQNIDWISRNAEYAIILGEKEFWGKGIGRKASDLLLYHGFVKLNLERIYCGTSSRNTGMQKLAIYLGMVKEGERRRAQYKNGEYVNIIEYGILKGDYLNKENDK